MNYIGTQKKDPYSSMNEISWGKKEYTTGTDGTKKWASNYTQPYYQNLYNSGYGDIADFFKGANADTAYGYQKGYQKGANDNIYAKQYVDTNKYIEDQRKYANNVLDNSYAGQKAVTDNQIQNLKAQYDDTNRKHYINYLKSKNALPQQLSAMGYTGGLTETSALNLANEYANNVYDTETQKNSEIAGLNAQLLKAYYDKEAQKAQNEAQYAQMGLNQYNTDRDWAFSREQVERGLENSNYWNNKNFDYQAGRDKIADDFNNRQLSQQKELSEAELYNALVLAQMKNKGSGSYYPQDYTSILDLLGEDEKTGLAAGNGPTVTNKTRSLGWPANLIYNR